MSANIHKGNIGVQTNNKVLNCLQKHTLSHKYNKFYSISRLFINSTITNNIIKNCLRKYLFNVIKLAKFIIISHLWGNTDMNELFKAEKLKVLEKENIYCL